MTTATNVMNDARFGVRLLWRSPGFTAVALLALALGIGATTSIFSVVYATLLAPLPFPHPEQLVMVWSRIKGFRNGSAAAAIADWKKQATVFQDLNAWTDRNVGLTSGGAPEQVQAQITTPGLLSMMGHRMLLGRDFLPEEGVPGKDHVAVLTNAMWQARFGGDPGLLGRDIRIDGRPHRVVGILAPGPADRLSTKMYLPMAFTPEQLNYEAHWLTVMGRLKPGVSLAQANANMTSVANGIAEAHPESNKGWGASVEPLQNNFLSRETIAGLWLLLGAVAFVLLIACANVANLLLARGTFRQREVAVRAALGASRGRVFAQFLTESLVLAATGGLLGVLLANILLGGIMALMPPFTLPSEADVRIDGHVLVFTVVLSVLSGIVFGCAPAWHATRSNLVDTLKEAGRSSSGLARQKLRRAFVVAQMALALTLLSGGGLAVRSLMKLVNVDLGFQRDHLITFSLPVPPGRLAEPERITTFYRALLEKIRAIPGVVSASASTGAPVQGNNFGMGFEVAGKPAPNPAERSAAPFNMITPDYFRTFGMRLVKGRSFSDDDRAGRPRVAVVNETFVKKFLGDADPLTQRLRIEEIVPGQPRVTPAVEWQIVGVVRDVRNAGPRQQIEEIAVPFLQSPWPSATVAVRTTVDPESVRNSIAAVVASLDPELPMADVKTMDQIVDEALATDRFSAVLFGGFAVLALLLAAVGVYGVMSFTVAQRTHEIGLRMALGAGRFDVVRGVLREGLGTAAAGVVLGTLGAYGVGRAMQGMWYQVGAMDPLGFGAVAALLLGAAALACLIPARRAASLDPMVALRED
jgi:putative ABC transport system permease protein